MSISKAVVLCCALMGAYSVSAQTISTVDGRVLVQHNPPGDLIGQRDASVPPDPYRTLLHNPPGDKTLVNNLSIPPDPYVVADKTAIENKTVRVDVMHNPPMY